MHRREASGARAHLGLYMRATNLFMHRQGYAQPVELVQHNWSLRTAATLKKNAKYITKAPSANNANYVVQKSSKLFRAWSLREHCLLIT